MAFYALVINLLHKSSARANHGKSYSCNDCKKL
jgi:hypothetical protein